MLCLCHNNSPPPSSLLIQNVKIVLISSGETHGTNLDQSFRIHARLFWHAWGIQCPLTSVPKCYIHNRIDLHVVVDCIHHDFLISYNLFRPNHLQLFLYSTAQQRAFCWISLKDSIHFHTCRTSCLHSFKLIDWQKCCCTCETAPEVVTTQNQRQCLKSGA